MSDAVAMPSAARPRARVSALPSTLKVGATLLLLIAVVALAPGLFAPDDPLRFDYDHLLAAPSLAHPLGTDEFGRDMLSRVVWGTAVDAQIALLATVPALVAGTTIGALAGYLGGWAETIVTGAIGVVVAFPFLVLVIAIVTVVGPGLIGMYIATALVGWVFYARLTLGAMRVQRGLDYAAAARVLGFGPARIMLRHLLPNVLTAVVVYWMTDMALAILLGSSLGFLGLGAQPPIAEWGALIAGGKNFIATAPWMTLAPGVAIVVSGLGFSVTGDGLAALLAVER